MASLLTLIFAFTFTFAQQVEIKLPEFSEKIQEQGKEKEKKSSDYCTAESSGPNSKMSCGTEKPTAVGTEAKLGELGGENSQYAADQVRQNSSKK